MKVEALEDGYDGWAHRKKGEIFETKDEVFAPEWMRPLEAELTKSAKPSARPKNA